MQKGLEMGLSSKYDRIIIKETLMAHVFNPSTRNDLINYIPGDDDTPLVGDGRARWFDDKAKEILAEIQTRVAIEKASMDIYDS